MAVQTRAWRRQCAAVDRFGKVRQWPQREGRITWQMQRSAVASHCDGTAEQCRGKEKHRHGVARLRRARQRLRMAAKRTAGAQAGIERHGQGHEL